MSAKIGTLLLESGLITPEQLEDALQAQIMFGGRLGTNLIELGLVDEEKLARLLGKQMNIPFCEAGAFQSIPEELLKLFNKGVVEKHRVLPIRLDGNNLWVAMMEPNRLPAVDEIAFLTNYQIYPMIASEIQIIDAMERYYNIPKEERYIEITEAKKLADAPLNRSTKDFFEPEPEPHKPASKPAPVSARKSETTEYIKSSKPRISLRSHQHPEVEQMDLSEEDSSLPLNDLAEILTETRSKEDILQAISSPFIEFFDRHFLFVNKNNHMVAVQSHEAGRSEQAATKISIPLKVPSIVRDVVELKEPFLGQFPEGHNNQKISSLLKYEPEKGPFLLCPVPLIQKVGMIIFADRCRDVQEVARRLKKFDILCTKAGLAFQVLVLKQKILQL